jgi:hypothetical protein
LCYAVFVSTAGDGVASGVAGATGASVAGTTGVGATGVVFSIMKVVSYIAL